MSGQGRITQEATEEAVRFGIEREADAAAAEYDELQAEAAAVRAEEREEAAL